MKNNYVYDILYKSNILFQKDLQININDMQYLVADQIARFNEDRGGGGGRGVGGKKLTWETFKRKVMVMFANYRLFDNVTFRGFGLASASSMRGDDDDDVDAAPLVRSADPADRVRLIDLRRYLQNVRKTSSAKLQETVAECKKRFAYDKSQQVFAGVRLRSKE